MLTNDSREARLFIKIALIVGVLLVFITPPMCTPDENAHFLNAYSVSRGDFFPEVVDGQLGRYVSTNVLQFKDAYTGKYDGKFDERYSFGSLYFGSWLPNQDPSETFYASTLTEISPVGYLVSGLGMAIGGGVGDLFEPHVNRLPYNLMLYGRIANLAFYLAVIYIALKIAPRFKKVMLMIALMPMSIYLGASLNYDAILIPTTMLLVALVLRLLDEQHAGITKGDIAAVLFCTFFLVGIKQAYAPLLLMLLAVPIKKYGGKKSFYFCIGATAIVGLVAYIPTLIGKQISGTVPNQYAEVLAAQATYVKENILLLPEIIANTFSRFSGFYLEGFWGKLGQLDTNFPVPFLVLFYLVLLVVAASEVCTSDTWAKQQWKRSLPFIGVIISLSGIFFSMYLGWTPLPGIADGVGTNYVSGVQGRYLIPLFLPTLLCLVNGIFRSEYYAKRADFLAKTLSESCAVCCGAITVLIVYMRYW